MGALEPHRAEFGPCCDAAGWCSCGFGGKVANWKITILKFGKSTNFLWAIFNSYVSHYQRVYIYMG